MVFFLLPFLVPQIQGRIEDALKPDVSEEYTPYAQKRISIDHLFVDHQERFSTTTWARILAESSSTYQSCRVVSLSWAKALASPLSHEFVQFIVEDKHTGVRTRVFSDRTDEPEPDRVIVGRDWATSKNPSDQKDLPMPLKSLTFNTNKQPMLGEFAQLLAVVTAREPKYSIVDNTMCWWYAQSVYETAKAHFGGEAKEWPFVRYAYKMVVWDYIVTPKEEMEAAARRFKKQNVEGMSYQTSANVKKQITPEDYLSKVTGMLEDDGNLKEYEEALRVDDNEQLDPGLLKAALQDIGNSPTKLPTNTTEYEQASTTFVKAILGEPENAENRAAFEAAWQKNMREENNVADDDDRLFYMTREFHSGPGQEKKGSFDYAMQCFVGGVLRIMNKDEGAEEKTAASP